MYIYNKNAHIFVTSKLFLQPPRDAFKRIEKSRAF